MIDSYIARGARSRDHRGRVIGKIPATIETSRSYKSPVSANSGRTGIAGQRAVPKMIASDERVFIVDGEYVAIVRNNSAPPSVKPRVWRSAFRNGRTNIHENSVR